MNRRELFGTAGAAVLVASATAALAEEKHEGHDHPAGGHQDHASGPVLHRALVEAATNCTKTGLACINHCFESLTAGDTAMAGCARSVDQMLSVCGTLAKLASTGSPHLAGIAKVTEAVCRDCEKECRKHAEHHAVCKACAEACAACAEECKKISG